MLTNAVCNFFNNFRKKELKYSIILSFFCYFSWFLLHTFCSYVTKYMYFLNLFQHIYFYEIILLYTRKCHQIIWSKYTFLQPTLISNYQYKFYYDDYLHGIWFFHSFTFSIISLIILRYLHLKQISCRQHVIESYFYPA